MNILKHINGILIDIDGTLLAGEKDLPGLIPFMTFLEERQIQYLILTNNSTKPPEFYSRKFANLGVTLPVTRVLTSAMATASFIQSHYSGRAVYLIGEEGLHTAFLERGFQVVNQNQVQADFVVVGGDHFLTYDKLKYGCTQLQSGAQLIGTNPDVVSPSEEGLIPECGTNIAALEAASGMKAIVIGKPNPYMFEGGLKLIATHPGETGILGDRLETDIQGGKQVGLHTILVETGVDSSSTAKIKGIHPDLIVRDLIDLKEKWHRALAE